MGNKKLRNTLLAFAMTPFFALAATGCWKATTNTELSESKQSEVYSVLRSHVIKDNFVINTDSNAIEINYENKETTTTDWTNSNIPEDKRESIAEELEIPFDNDSYEYKDAEIFGYNYLDNTGYKISKDTEYDKDENNNELDTKSYKITEMSFVKKSGDDYLIYEYDYRSSGEDRKLIYRVDDKYAVNTYTQDLTGCFHDAINSIFDITKENETLDSFKQTINSFYDNVDNQKVNIKIDISLSDNTYSLVLTLDGEFLDEENILQSTNLNFAISFNNNFIENIDFETNNTYKTTIHCKDELDTTLDLTFNTEDHIIVTESWLSSCSIDLLNDFDQTIIDQDVSDYKPTGSMGDIKNKDVTLYFKYVDFEDFYGDGYHCIYNKLLNLGQNSSQYFTNDHVTKTYYWDKECTKPVLSSDTAPSYETNIYVKLTVDDGYAAVMQNIIYTDGYSYSSNPKVVNISTEKYNLYVYDDIIKVVINGKEITDYDNGITLTESGIYTINVNVSN